MEPTENPDYHRLTHRALDYTPDDGNRYEVIDGELHVTPAPFSAHQRVLSELHGLLWYHVKAHRLGHVYPAGLKVVLDEPTGVQPDIVFISTERLAGLRDDGFYGAPDLLVEVVSSKPQLDRWVKFHKYALAGVPHYWIADPKARALDVFGLEGKEYRPIAQLKDDAVFEPSLFPGLKIDLGELWL